MLGRIDIAPAGPPQSVLRDIPEGAIQKLTVRAFDSDLAATTPSSARYRIDSLSGGGSVLGWTSLTPSTAMSIVVTAAQNAKSTSYPRERRQILIEASDSDGPVRTTFDYDLIDLQGVP